MKRSKVILLGSITAGLVALATVGAFQNATAMGKKPAQEPAAEKKAEVMAAPTTYSGTFYVAAMGGHFAKAVTTIDPSKADPFTVTELTKIDIGDGKSHPTHDARIDCNDSNVMYWSTYLLDPAADNQTHIGKSDLTTGEVIVDKTVPTPAGVLNTGKNYCASGQSSDYYFPIAMTKPGYISVVRKSDMQVMHHVFVEGTDADPGQPYKYMHGISSPDMKEFLITMNLSDTPGKDYGHSIGKLALVVLDTAALEQGKIKVLRKGMADGNKDTTVSFRQYFSPDGKLIANGTGDILFLIDAKTLKTIDTETVGHLEELHDAMFTPDSKYVIATSRTKRVKESCTDPNNPKSDEFLMDGELKLYDVAAKKFIGSSTSVCLRCHDEELGTGDDAVHAVLCGIDANWKK